MTLNRFNDMPFKLEAGFSLPEFIIALGIASFIFLILGNIFGTTTKMLTTTRIKMMSTEKLQAAMDKVETLLLNATRFDLALSTEVIFVADSSTNPGFDKDADFDGDGIKNSEDADRDNDANSIVSDANSWTVGTGRRLSIS